MRILAAAFTVAFAGGAAWAQPCPTPSAANQACTGTACAELSVGTDEGAVGEAVTIPISFVQGDDDSQPGGSDDVSAIAFTLGIPGTGGANPLTFDCTDGNLAEGSVQVASGIDDDFTVVVENAQCSNRTRCLCPTAAEHTRADFVNIVVYGPKTLPDQGPVEIPVLPPSGELLRLTMRIAAGAPEEIPLHLFAATDNGTPERPQFAANLSLGDQIACDVTGDGQDRSRITLTDGLVRVGGTGPACVGDCNLNRTVVINELITGVNMALGNLPITECAAFNPNGDNQISINELIQGVNNASNGCPA
jgi:hypothetical protein